MDTKIEKIALFGKTLTELKEIVESLNFPGFTAKQIALWLYKKNINSIDEMTNLSLSAREILNKNYFIGTIKPIDKKTSQDGTLKYLFATDNGKFIETAYIPEENRNTLCVSSQVGCKMACVFCMTGKQGFQNHLSAGEIVNQLKSIDESEQVSNIVFMGMGEPLDNLENVLKALEILTSNWGFEMSPKRITVSTIGILDALKKFLQKSECNLAVSLHNPFDDERQKIMPIQKAQPIERILQEIKEWDFSRNRRVSFEYIMFKDFNDTKKHVNELAKILNGIKCKINLIRFHPVPTIDISGSADEAILEFQSQLRDKGIFTTIRASRGLDIDAACGLLSTKALLEKG
ncbi:MAG: 23S rRNA (adenine(2503)-C(2))-methyltransferase RlmN [Bacteroidales bacterium]|nr:23S rRNA (adenine(2503)-C(2))-methyltransferase RlmN [Bacteroidales bacterium]MBN2758493.1 23S rRNA (adenine(2503)-C(2))-methyltransferase RlmN [Bacteroidales bacterium]